MTELQMPSNIFMPYEVVDLIADFRDYEKYYKPSHYENLKGVINDIGDMAGIMQTISPSIVWQCWGPGCIPNTVWDETLEYNFGIENDDEENNFGLDYDDTHYYSDISNDTDSYSEEEDDEQPYRASSEEGYFGGFWYNGWDSDN